MDIHSATFLRFAVIIVKSILNEALHCIRLSVITVSTLMLAYLNFMKIILIFKFDNYFEF